MPPRPRTACAGAGLRLHIEQPTHAELQALRPADYGLTWMFPFWLGNN
jgi:hypothetical protein